MNYQELYQQKLTTAGGSGEGGQVRRLGGLRLVLQPSRTRWIRRWPPGRTSCIDVKIRGGVTMWMPEVCKAD